MTVPQKFGKYTLLKRIGLGGTAEVYRATCPIGRGINKVVALKRLLECWSENENLKKIILDESRLMSCLRHQNIVQIFEAGEIENIPYIAMEFVDGVDCDCLIKRVKERQISLPSSYVLFIMLHILTAIDYAHNCINEDGRRLKIVHRDLSPSNILISWHGEIKVTDFGIAKGIHKSSLTAAGQLRGKYPYMSPEQASCKPIDSRSDIFSAGSVFYELLKTEKLFEGENDFEVLKKVREASFHKSKMALLPSLIKAAIYPALSLSLEERFSSAKVMLERISMARSYLGPYITSLDISALMSDLFKDECAGDIDNLCVLEESTRATSVMAQNVIEKNNKGLSVKTCLKLILLTLLIFLTSSSQAVKSERHSVDSIGIFSPKKVSVAPKRRSGKISITSTPDNADIDVKIGDETGKYKTPFIKSDIDVGNDVRVEIKIAKNGFKSQKRIFVLSAQDPAFVDTFTLEGLKKTSLFVSARPWGLVTVDGYANKSETPLSIKNLKPGKYNLIVEHPPSSIKRKKIVDVGYGQKRKCFVNFSKQKNISCR